MGVGREPSWRPSRLSLRPTQIPEEPTFLPTAYCGSLRFVLRRVRQSRWAAELAAITRTNAECRLSINVALGGTATSIGLVAAGASPDASRPTSVAACRRPVEAVSTHCMAVARAATRDGVPSLRRFLREPLEGDGPDSSTPPAARSPVADRTLARLPRAAWSRFSACGLGTGVEPATARFTVWCSTTELTVTHG